MYRIFGCPGGATDDLLIQALTTAVADKNDILSLSLGKLGGWPSSPSSVVASRIVAQGTAIITSSGNAGIEGAFYGQSPAASPDVDSVGAVDNTQFPVYSAFVQTGSGERQVSLLTLDPLNVPTGKLPVKIIDPSVDTLRDACDADKVAAAGPFNNTVVVVGQADCYWITQSKNIFDNGGNLVLVYGRPAPAGNIFIYTDNQGQQIASLLRDEGVYIKQQVASGAKVQIDFSRQKLSVMTDKQGGGRMSWISTMSPYNDLTGSTLAAPGGNILGASPLSK